MAVTVTDAMSRRTVNLDISAMIVGAEKAGTSALVSHLGSLQEICIPMGSGSQLDLEFASEFPYFLSDNNSGVTDLNELLRQSLPRDFDPERHYIVAKNVGLCTDRAAMGRLHMHSPGVKVIFLLREPISRAMSSHRYQLFRGAEQEADFSRAAKDCLEDLRITDRHIDYLRRGLYARQVAELIEEFGPSNCLFLRFEDIVGDRADGLSLVCDFIGLESPPSGNLKKVNAAKEPRSLVLAALLFRDNVTKRLLRQLLPLQARVRLAATFRRLNSRSASPKTSSAMPPQLKARLRDYFREDLARTESLTGLDLLRSWDY